MNSPQKVRKKQQVIQTMIQTMQHETGSFVAYRNMTKQIIFTLNLSEKGSSDAFSGIMQSLPWLHKPNLVYMLNL